MRRKVGQKLYLGVQLGDGGDGGTTRVFAQIEQQDATVLTAEFEIAHIADGRYREEVQVMPDEDVIVIQYFIRRSNGITPSNRYDPNFLSETILKDVTGQLVEDNLDAKVSSAIDPDITGLLEDELLVGAIEDENLIADLNNDLIIEGEVCECS